MFRKSRLLAALSLATVFAAILLVWSTTNQPTEFSQLDASPSSKGALASLGLEVNTPTGEVKLIEPQHLGSSDSTGFASTAFAEESANGQLVVENLQTRAASSPSTHRALCLCFPMITEEGNMLFDCSSGVKSQHDDTESSASCASGQESVIRAVHFHSLNCPRRFTPICCNLL